MKEYVYNLENGESVKILSPEYVSREDAVRICESYKSDTKNACALAEKRRMNKVQFSAKFYTDSGDVVNLGGVVYDFSKEFWQLLNKYSSLPIFIGYETRILPD